MSSCEVCGITLRSDNRSGLCCNRSRPACTRERQRREALRAAAATGGRCLCGHSPDHHSRNAAGPQAGPCLASLCGCLWWRPDPEIREAA